MVALRVESSRGATKRADVEAATSTSGVAWSATKPFAGNDVAQ